MRLIDVIRLASRNFRTNTLRTFLTILAVSIATAAILFLVSFGYGLQLLTVQRIASSSAISTIDVLPVSDKSLIKLDDSAVQKIKALPNVADVALQLDVEAEGQATSIGSTVIHAVSPHYFELADIRPEIGGIYDQNSTHSAVVSSGFLAQFGLSDDANALAKQFNLTYAVPAADQSSAPATKVKDQTAYKIAGVIKDDDVSYAYVQLSDAAELVKGVQYANFKVQASDRSKVLEVKDSISSMGYDASAPLETLQQLDQVFAIVQISLGALGVIALIISSIGMFNTMTISLLERTREIGIMKAIGADKSDVWKLFLAEATIIGFLGGLCGVVIGIGMAFVANTTLNVLAGIYGGEQATLFYSPPWFIFAIIAFSTIVGSITGFYPARRAAGLNPLKALRYE